MWISNKFREGNVNKMMRFLFSLAVLVLVFSCAVNAQVNTGSISGTVHDSSGAAIVGATVTATNTATGEVHTAISGNIGQYTLQGLPPATYKVRVTNTSFKTLETTVEVIVGSPGTFNPQLEVGSSTTVVEVTAAFGTEVNTQTQELSQLVDTQQLASLPSLNRNPYDFVVLSGNVSNADNTTASMNSSQSTESRGVGYSINGQRMSGVEILLDGVENVGIFSVNAGQLVPADSIQEFSIVTNNFGAEYGRASGGIVNVDTKPGTNDIHGSVFEYNRLSAYTANTFANDSQNAVAGSDVAPKGIYTRNQFGFNLGAPIIKNKLFASFSQEFTRVRSAAAETEDVFDPAFMALMPGNVQAYWSKYGTGALPSSATITAAQVQAAGGFGQTCDTATPPNCTNNPIPLLNGIGTGGVGLGASTIPGTTPVFDTINFGAPFDAGGGVPQNTYNLVGRLDYNLSAKTQLFFRFAQYSESDFAGADGYSPYPQYDVGGTSFDNSGMLSVNHSFTDNVLNNIKISFTRFNVANSFNQALTSTPNLFVNTTTSQSADPVTNNTIQLPGLQNSTTGTGGLPFGGPQNTTQIVEDLAWTKGRHTMRFGGEFTYIQLNVGYGAYAQSVEALGAQLPDSFNSLFNAGGVTDPSSEAFASPIIQFTARVNANGALPCPTDIYGNAITPLPTSCLVQPPLSAATYNRSYRYKDWALYAQDSFKITRRLTLNYGIRYEHFGVQHNNKANLDSNFYPASGGFADAVRDGGVFPTQQSPIGQFWANRWGTPAPRVGFAYDVFGDGKTALRGGFGMSYERNFGNVTFNASFNPPASAVLSDVCTESGTVVYTCPYFVTTNNVGPLGQPGEATGLPNVELRDNDANINVSQTQFWSLGMERQLIPNTLLAVYYSGAHGVHLYDINNINLLGSGQEYAGDPLVTGTSEDGTETCPYGDPVTGTPTCYTRLNSQYTNINRRGSTGVSTYNAMNVKFQTQNIHHTGLTLVANYTWAHSLDDLSTTFSESETAASLGYTNVLNPQLDYGNSDFDVRHRLVLSPIWQTPWFKSGKGLATQVLGGWTISGIYTVRTGIPFSVYDLTDLLNYYVIPRIAPSTPITNWHVTGSPAQNYDSHNNPIPNQFIGLNVPAPANLGPLNPTLDISDFGPYPSNMTGRNSFRGPGAWNLDASIQKDFKLTERFGLQFRAEAFDLFNHHNYYVNAGDNYTVQGVGPSQVIEEKGGLGNGALGGNHDERRFMQFSLRLTF
jgi:Carboxypeptidase regulatory-like domain